MLNEDVYRSLFLIVWWRCAIQGLHGLTGRYNISERQTFKVKHWGLNSVRKFELTELEARETF